MIGPLLFEPVLLEKVWGGDRLARLGKGVRPGARVGESWEIADLAATSAGGAGGGSISSKVASGALRGRTLRDLMLERPGEISGPTGGAFGAPFEGAFPLLIKYLDARENLSVQVHPSPALADPARGLHLKTECWTIVDAEPGAVIYKGVKPGVTAGDLREGAASGAIVQMIEAVPAVVGQTHNLPSGTVHALGAGVLVAEVQTPSDTTFRLYDWGREGRSLHVEESLRHAMLGVAPRATSYASPLSSDGPWRRIVETEFFLVDEGRGREDMTVAAPGEMAVLMVLRGSGTLVDARGSHTPMSLRAGDTALVPSSCWGGEGAQLRGEGETTVLRVRRPQATRTTMYAS